MAFKLLLSRKTLALIMCIFTLCHEGNAGKPRPKGASPEKFIKLLETPFSVFFLSVFAEDPATAEHICQEQNGHLVVLNNVEDSKALYKKLEGFSADYDQIWTSGISYSNSSVEDLLLWNATMEPINETNANFHIPPGQKGNAGAAYIRNRREVVSIDKGEGEGDTDNCDDCCNTTPQPFTRRPCRKPSCDILIPNPPCQETKPRNCTLTGLPNCTVQQSNCTVDCKEECRVIRQPVCKIKEPTKPRCHLKQPGPCVIGTPNCTIVSIGACRSVQDKCEQDESNCKPIIKPCKSPCTDRECQSTRSPCKKGTDCPSVTSCTRPFVDCSPEICQSNVQICLAPNIRCPSPRIICDSPVVKCETGVGDCPTPEVECEEPEVECSKPVVECPDALVNCDPTVTACGQAPVSCTEPEMDCKSPEVSCEEPVTCPPDEGVTESYSNCKCKGKQCNGKRKTKSKSGIKDALTLPGEIEFVEKTSCIALKRDVGFKWVMQSCSLKHRFMCQRHKSKKEGGKGLAELLGFAF